MSRIRAVLFDLDETLFDHAHGVEHAVRLLREDHESLQAKPLEDILAEHRRILEGMHLDVLAGRISVDQARIERMRGMFTYCGADISDSAAHAAATLHRQRYQEARRAIPGAPQLLDTIRTRGVKVVIVTNNLLEEQRDKLTVCGLRPHVDVLVTSEEYGCTKPDPKLFRIALGLAGCAQEEAVMVGDAWDTDIVGARNAGIRAVWFNRMGQAQPAGESITEITSLEPAKEVARIILTAG